MKYQLYSPESNYCDHCGTPDLRLYRTYDDYGNCTDLLCDSCRRYVPPSGVQEDRL